MAEAKTRHLDVINKSFKLFLKFEVSSFVGHRVGVPLLVAKTIISYYQTYEIISAKRLDRIS